jgi:phytoene synthase
MHRRQRDQLFMNSPDKEPSIPQEIENLMSKHDPILLYASRLLPSQTASDASALYAWCRRLDEITDDSEADIFTKKQQLMDWEDRFYKLYNGKPLDEMDQALYQCIQRNSGSLTKEPFLDMIAGMKSDAVPNRRIKDMAELEEYAYQVAGTVGVMLLPLLIADVQISCPPAIAMGKSIQLINILRDASSDAALGRIYLPQDMLRIEGVSGDDILMLKSSDGYCKVVREVATRAQELLLEAERGKSTLPGIGPLFVQIIVELYRVYLVRLEELGYDNLNVQGERVKISTMQKLSATVRALMKTIGQ